MTLIIEVATDGVRLPLPRARVEAVARHVLEAEQVSEARLSITFSSTRRIATLNREHLGHHGSTDVISFGLKSDVADAPVTGDIYIAPDVARRNAATHGVPAVEEITRLVIHGVLHVLGFDHPEGTGRTESAMWQRQEELLLGLLGRADRRSATVA
jgi:probable rRNA maturation factor